MILSRWVPREVVGSGASRRAMEVRRLLLSHFCPMSGAGGARRRQIGRGGAGDRLFSQRRVEPPPRAVRGAPRCCPARGDIGRRRQIGRPAAGDGSVAQRGGSLPPRAARGAPLCCPARGDVGRARQWQIRRGRCWRRISCTLGGVHANGSRIAFTNTCKCRRWCSG